MEKAEAELAKRLGGYIEIEWAGFCKKRFGLMTNFVLVSWIFISLLVVMPLVLGIRSIPETKEEIARMETTNKQQAFDNPNLLEKIKVSKEWLEATEKRNQILLVILSIFFGLSSATVFYDFKYHKGILYGISPRHLILTSPTMKGFKTIKLPIGDIHPKQILIAKPGKKIRILQTEREHQIFHPETQKIQDLLIELGRGE